MGLIGTECSQFKIIVKSCENAGILRNNCIHFCEIEPWRCQNLTVNPLWSGQTRRSYFEGPHRISRFRKSGHHWKLTVETLRKCHALPSMGQNRARGAWWSLVLEPNNIGVTFENIYTRIDLQRSRSKSVIGRLATSESVFSAACPWFINACCHRYQCTLHFAKHEFVPRLLPHAIM